MMNLNMKLTPHKKELLKEFVEYECDNCHKVLTSKELVVHHINRKCWGGLNHFRNLMVLCKSYHKKMHQNEFRSFSR